MLVKGLKAPRDLHIDFAPSPRQYELWKLLQPNYCPHCGGSIELRLASYDSHGKPVHAPVCTKCGSSHLPQIILGGGAGGGGKMGLLDSKVCTPFGFRKVKDLKVGDIITSATTGKQQRVIQLHPIEEHHFYRVSFVDGTHFDCSEGHLWQYHIAGKRSKKTDSEGNKIKERVGETRELFEWMNRKKRGMYKGNNIIIPLCAPVQFTHPSSQRANKPIKPYILGALLGNGCMATSIIQNGKVSLCTADQEIVDQFEAHGIDMSRYGQKENAKAKDYFIYDSEIIAGLKKLNLIGCVSENKFIPFSYKYGTIDERIELIQGLMDTDGYIDERGHLSYSSTSHQLAEDVAFVIRSLGGKATIKRNPAGYKDKGGTYIKCKDVYDVYIHTKMNPDLVSLTRKKERCKYEFNGGVSELGKRITDIKYLGKRTGRCITVDEPCGLYVADDFTVTHNSYVGSCWIIINCLRFPDSRAVVARKTLKALKGSTFNTIKLVLRTWGLVEGENYKVNNLEGIVTFYNGSTISLIELEDLPSDPEFERLGSNEWGFGFVDECSQVSEKAIEVLFSRLRWNTDSTFIYPRLLLTTNPCMNWVRSRFVQDEEGNPAKLAPHDAYVPFTVFDNPNKSFVATYRASLDKISDPVTRNRILYGNWDFIETNEAAAYWNFDGEVHLMDSLKEKVYNPLKPIIISFDFNVAPFMSSIAMQIDYESQNVYVLEEILGKPETKENNTPKLAEKISKKYLAEKHMGGLIITGDPAGLARSTQTEEGVNNFTIISQRIHPMLRATRKLLSKQPPQTTRLEFVNALFNNYKGWNVYIDMRCRKLTEDLIYQKKNGDGTKSKAKYLDTKLGVKCEKYGHLSDCLDYALCLFLSKEWNGFQKNGNAVGVTTVHNMPVYGSFDY